MSSIFWHDESLKKFYNNLPIRFWNNSELKQINSEAYKRTEERKGMRNRYKEWQLTTKVGAMRLNVSQIPVRYRKKLRIINGQKRDVSGRPFCFPQKGVILNFPDNINACDIKKKIREKILTMNLYSLIVYHVIILSR